MKRFSTFIIRRTTDTMFYLGGGPQAREMKQSVITHTAVKSANYMDCCLNLVFILKLAKKNLVRWLSYMRTQ